MQSQNSSRNMTKQLRSTASTNPTRLNVTIPVSYKQSYSLSNLESTSPILNLLEDNNTNADKKRDLDKLSDLLPEKATKHRSVAHYKDNNNSTPSNSSTVTEDSENKNINKTDKSSKKSGGYIPIHKREQKQNSLLYSFQTITKN